MSLNRKRKKELRRLQNQAAKLWETQQVLVGQAGEVAREAGRQLGNYNREHVVPTVQHSYDKFAAPYVEQGVETGRRVLNNALVPAAGAVVGTALSVWDVANDKRHRLAHGKSFGDFDLAKFKKNAAKAGKKATKQFTVAPPAKKGIGAGGVIAIILGVAATSGVLYAAWQTLRADDELWVADDPLRAPDA
ncbi:DNA helicase [Microbacterium marinum]|uniref:DNA helicase n=1 Tax=Microbacterium marinum TaxID=421115 RepID=UPI00384D68F6